VKFYNSAKSKYQKYSSAIDSDSYQWHYGRGTVSQKWHLAAMKVCAFRDMARESIENADWPSTRVK
jgi:hypothetical protein